MERLTWDQLAKLGRVFAGPEEVAAQAQAFVCVFELAAGNLIRSGLVSPPGRVFISDAEYREYVRTANRVCWDARVALIRGITSDSALTPGTPENLALVEWARVLGRYFGNGAFDTTAIRNALRKRGMQADAEAVTEVVYEIAAERLASPFSPVGVLIDADGIQYPPRTVLEGVREAAGATHRPEVEQREYDYEAERIVPKRKRAWRLPPGIGTPLPTAHDDEGDEEEVRIANPRAEDPVASAVAAESAARTAALVQVLRDVLDAEAIRGRGRLGVAAVVYVLSERLTEEDALRLVLDRLGIQSLPAKFTRAVLAEWAGGTPKALRVAEGHVRTLLGAALSRLREAC